MVGIDTLTDMSGHLLVRKARKGGTGEQGVWEAPRAVPLTRRRGCGGRIAGSDAPATQRAGQPAEVDMAARDEQHRRIHAG